MPAPAFYWQGAVLCGIGNGNIALENHGCAEGESTVDGAGIHFNSRDRVKLIPVSKTGYLNVFCQRSSPPFIPPCLTGL